MSLWSVAGKAVAIGVLIAASLASAAEAQTRPGQRSAPLPPQPTIGLRAFADFGSTSFTAAKSFEAVLGSSRGPIFGGGLEVVLRRNIFVNFRASRFQASGERVFISGGTQFNLGIDTKVTVTPVELTAGYRVVRPRWRMVPYGGGGVGWHGYEETSTFATDAENVKDRFTGFQLLGGVEYRLGRWIAAAGEAQWTTVPDGLGQDPNGVSRELGDTNLGGVTVRVKVVIGR